MSEEDSIWLMTKNKDITKYEMNFISSYSIGELCKWITTTGGNPEEVLDIKYFVSENKYDIIINSTSEKIKCNDVIIKEESGHYTILK